MVERYSFCDRVLFKNTVIVCDRILLGCSVTWGLFDFVYMLVKSEVAEFV